MSHMQQQQQHQQQQRRSFAWKDDAMQSFTADSIINSAVAGYAAGVSGVAFGHPLDSAKVWLQTNSAGSNKHLSAVPADAAVVASTSAPTKPAGAAVATSTATSSTTASTSGMANRPLHTSGRAMMSTLAAQSPFATATAAAPTLRSASSPYALTASLRTLRALYSGISGPLITVGLVQSANFTCYDALRRMLHRMDVPDAAEMAYLNNDALKNVALAGFMTGGTLAFITSPLVMIKTKQQVTGDSFREVLRDALRPNTRNQRIWSNFFVGFAPHFVSESFGRAIYYAAYEGLKRSWSQYKLNQTNNNGNAHVKLSVEERMICAAASGISCWALIFPFDSVRSRMMIMNQSKAVNHKTTLQMVHSIYKENGSSVRIFYRGFGLTVLRAGPVAAAVLPIYDYVLEMLQSRR